MISKLTPRLGYFLGFLTCGLLLAYALYLQYYEYQEPCPLCIFQRVAFLVLGIFFLVGAVHGPKRVGVYVYSTLQFIAAGVGAVIATRHVWLQHLPKDKVPECGPGLSYILERFPFSQALDKVFRGSGECAEVGWTFLHLSIAEWSLVCFVALAILAIAVAVVASKRASVR